MVKKHTFRVICLVIALLGIVFILISNLGSPFELIGVLLCIFLVVFAYISTGRWGKYFGGESFEEKGGFGN